MARVVRFYKLVRRMRAKISAVVLVVLGFVFIFASPEINTRHGGHDWASGNFAHADTPIVPGDSVGGDSGGGDGTGGDAGDGGSGDCGGGGDGGGDCP